MDRLHHNIGAFDLSSRNLWLIINAVAGFVKLQLAAAPASRSLIVRVCVNHQTVVIAHIRAQNIARAAAALMRHRVRNVVRF